MIQNPIEEIKNRLDIVKVIGEYIKLKKAGANYRAVCPFHSEKKPSFFVSPARQIFKCFGCNLSGDIFGFVKQIEGVEFGDALRILARKAGVELKRQDPIIQSQRNRLYEICELSCQFFEKQLQSNAGKQIQQYLLKRGINQDSQDIWRLGYAPDSWHGLSDFLKKKGFGVDELLKAGLCIKNEKGNVYDRFRKRIMFPIFDLSSQVVGFSGRRLVGQTEEIAKYVNTPSTILYDKSGILYGLDKAKVEIRKNNYCILVEGNVDIILSSQAGIKNIVATCGTALTSYQLDILKRYSNNLILAFDMDIAGDSATKRGINLAQEKGFDIKIIVMPKGKDPSDVILENPENWQKHIKDAKLILNFYFDSAFSKYDKKTVQGKQTISQMLLPVIKRIPNKIVQSHWIQKLAQNLGVREQDIRQELEKTKLESQNYQKEKPIAQIPLKSMDQVLQERLVILALQKPENIKIITEQDFVFFDLNTKEIFIAFKKYGANFDLLKNNLPKSLFEKLQLVSLKSDIEKNDEIDFEQEFKKCFNRIKYLRTKKELKDISSDLRQAEGDNNIEKVKSLTAQFNELAKKIK